MRAFSNNDNTIRDEMLVWKLFLAVFVVVGITAWLLRHRKAEGKYMVDKFYFTGLTSEGAGYVTEANELLKKHLEKGGYNNWLKNPFQDDQPQAPAQFGDSSLSFYIPPDGDISGIRLTGITRFYNEREKLFCFNSFLETHLKLQRQYPERKIFRINIERNARTDEIRIKSITIDPKLLSSPLISNATFWKGDLQASTDSLFKDYLFIKLAKTWLPVRNRQALDSLANPNAGTLKSHVEVDFFKEEDQFDLIMGSLLDNHSIYDIKLKNAQKLKISKTADSLEIIVTDAGDLQILFADSTQTFKVRNGDRLAIPLKEKSFEIVFRGGFESSTGTIYCTTENPFNFLSGMVQSNRRSYRHYADSSFSDLFAMVMAQKASEIENGFVMKKNEGSEKLVKVTANTILSKYLEKKLNQYTSTDAALKYWQDSTKPERTLKMGIVLLDTRRGDILAAPWIDNSKPANAFSKEMVNYNFINHPPGSCFKPFNMLACMRVYPSLHELRLQPDMFQGQGFFIKRKKGQQREKVYLLNYPTKSFYGHSNQQEDLFLSMAHSSNLYTPVATLYSVTENNRTLAESIRNGRFPSRLYNGPETEHTDICRVINDELYFRDFENSKLAASFATLFNVEKRRIPTNDYDQHDHYAWDPKYISNSGQKPDPKLQSYSSLSPERVSLNIDLLSNVVENPQAGNFASDVLSWLLGGQNNRWNNVKIAESFARLVTGRDLRSAFIADTSIQSESLFNISKDRSDTSVTNAAFRNAHVRLLDALHNEKNAFQKGAEGTWDYVAKYVSGIADEQGNKNYVILGKTGTSDDDVVPDISNLRQRPAKKTIHRGQFVFTIMTASQYESLLRYINSGYDIKLLPKKLGITGVVSLEMTDREGESDKYFSQHAARFLQFESCLEKIIALNKALF